MNVWTLRRNRRGPGIVKTFRERLNDIRKHYLFWTRSEVELYNVQCERIRTTNSYEFQKALAKRDHELFSREMRVVRAEVEMNQGMTVKFSLEVSESLLIHRDRRGNLDRQICESITRKMIDGLKFAADNRSVFKYQTRQY